MECVEAMGREEKDMADISGRGVSVGDDLGD